MGTETQVTDLIPAEKHERLEKALVFFESIQKVKITTKQQYDNAVELRKKVKAGIDSLEEDRKLLKQPYKEKVDLIDAEYRGVRVKLENVDSKLKEETERWFQEEDRKRQEQQRKLEAEAEARRRAAEEKAEAERRKAEEYAAQGREEMAAKAEARAEAALEKAETIVAPVVEAPKTAGVSYTVDYLVEVVDQSTAAKACLETPVLAQYVTLNTTGIKALVKQLKGNIQIAGLRITETRSTRVRG